MASVQPSEIPLRELSKAVIRVREDASIQSELRALHSEWSARRRPCCSGRTFHRNLAKAAFQAT